MFITFEALDGAGKSTQARLLAETLRKQGHDVVLTREPGGSPGAEEIRALILQGDTDRWSPMTEILLFNAARRDHLERTILPALKRGAIVICDRYVGSTLGLQVAGGEDRAMILKLHEIACDGIMPDLTFYLDLDVEVSLARSIGRLAAEVSAEDRFESKGDSFHRRVAREFEWQAKEFGWVRIDANRSIEAIHNSIAVEFASRAFADAL